MSGLKFSEEAARKLERLHLTKDVVAQRSETMKQLALSQGERVLDVGCGPGFLCESMADIVGRYGAVIGIDISDDLIELCRRRSGQRCSGRQRRRRRPLGGRGKTGRRHRRSFNSPGSQRDV